MIILLTIGLLAFGSYGRQTLDYIQINGPVYKDIIEGKDLVADILMRCEDQAVEDRFRAAVQQVRNDVHDSHGRPADAGCAGNPTSAR